MDRSGRAEHRRTSFYSTKILDFAEKQSELFLKIIINFINENYVKKLALSDWYGNETKSRCLIWHLVTNRRHFLAWKSLDWQLEVSDVSAGAYEVDPINHRFWSSRAIFNLKFITSVIDSSRLFLPHCYFPEYLIFYIIFKRSVTLSSVLKTENALKKFLLRNTSEKILNISVRQAKWRPVTVQNFAFFLAFYKS